jgi:O-antigen ligase
MKAYLVPALPGLAALGLWALLNLQRFLCVAVLATMIYPNALITPGGAQVALADILLVIAIGAWIVGNAVRTEPGPWIEGNRMVIPLLLFVGINVGSIAWSTNTHATTVFAVQVLEIAFVLPVVFASIPRSIDVIQQGQKAFIAVSAALGIAAFIAYLPRAVHGDTEGVYLWGIHKNAIGSFTAGGLVLAYTLLLQQEPARTRLLLGGLMLAEIAGLFASVSRGSILGALLGILVVSFALKQGRRASVMVVALSAIVFVAAIGTSSRGVKKDASGSYDSSIVRNYSYANAVDKIRERPLLGLGAGAYSDFIPELQIGLPDPNNMFLLTWAEIGAIGFGALLYLLYAFGALFRRVARLPSRYAVPGVAAGGVTLTFLVHAQVDDTWTRGQTSLGFAMIGLMLAAERLSLGERARESQVAPHSLAQLDLRGATRAA